MSDKDKVKVTRYRKDSCSAQVNLKKQQEKGKYTEGKGPGKDRLEGRGGR